MRVLLIKKDDSEPVPYEVVVEVRWGEYRSWGGFIGDDALENSINLAIRASKSIRGHKLSDPLPIVPIGFKLPNIG